MQPESACGHISTVRTNIRLATQLCGSADLTDLQRALNLLEATRSEMHRAEAAVRSGKLNRRADLQRESALLKRELACLMRVIDGCAALHRGLGIRLGCSSLSYSPQGPSLAALPAAAACEMQG